MTNTTPRDPFLGEDGRPRVLWGPSVNSGSTRVAEMAGRLGFETVWIEMEHASADLAGTEALCVAATAGGAIPLVRTAGYRREQILHALEVGGRLIVVPLVNDAATAREVVRHGKFRPLGQRGYNTRSRAAGFGLDPLPAARMNAETVLLPQIETREAVDNLDAILAVEGISGVFVGPGDLSSDLGMAGSFADPALRATVCDVIRRARAAGRHAGILATPGPLLEDAVAAGADLCIIGSDFGTLIAAWRDALSRCRALPRG